MMNTYIHTYAVHIHTLYIHKHCSHTYTVTYIFLHIHRLYSHTHIHSNVGVTYVFYILSVAFSPEVGSNRSCVSAENKRQKQSGI